MLQNNDIFIQLEQVHNFKLKITEKDDQFTCSYEMIPKE